MSVASKDWSFDQIQSQVSSWAGLCARVWFKDQCKDLSAQFYLYYKANDGNGPYHPIVATEPPNADWIRHGPSISRAQTIDQAASRIREALRSAPLL